MHDSYTHQFHIYRVVQTFDGGKFLTNQGWKNFDERKLDNCQCVRLIVILIVMLTAHTCCFINYTVDIKKG